MTEQAVADGLAQAWERYCNARDGRDRYEQYIADAEEAFASLAERNGLTWIEAVEIVKDSSYGVK